MRITRQTLLKIARDTVARRKRSERDLLAAYLRGSLLGQDPILGGTADIDLVLIHNSDPPVDREIERLTDDVHLDIVHHGRAVYRAGRKLREHPRMGPEIYSCMILYDPQHFVDFLQAGVRGHYFRPENVLGRAQKMVEEARGIWFDFYRQTPAPAPDTVARYLGAVELAANALASLTGPPLPERRLMLMLPERVEAIGREGLALGVLGLLGGNAVNGDMLRAWLPDWEAAVDAAGAAEGRPLDLHPYRKGYYLRALDAILASEQPLAALWPLLHTWTVAVCQSAADSPVLPAWGAACEQLAIAGEGFSERVAALDAFLDTTEDTLESWARAQGVG